MLQILLYAYRVLGISKDIIGIAFSIGALGFVAGVFAVSFLTKRLGIGKAVAFSCLANFSQLLVLFAGGDYAVVVIGLAFFVAYAGLPIYNINMVSLRQVITPNRLQGRMNATMRTIVWGTVPLGALFGGVFATSLGLVPTLVIGAVVSGFAALWIILGPIFKLQKQPDPVKD